MKKAPPAQNVAHLLLEKHLAELGIGFCREYHFAKPLRNWRFDYVLGKSGEALGLDKPNGRIALEIEGGLFSGGRHVRAIGYQKDLDKYNAATMMGYRVLRFSTTDILRGRAKAFLAEHLAQH